MAQRKSTGKGKTPAVAAAPARSRAGSSRKRSGPIELMILSDLEQVRVLADPLRVRILEALAEERTTKQVADRIGEKPTKLYHHVDALERVGLIRLTRTRRNRGTLERYYQIVALCFRADAGLFPRTGDAALAMDVVSNLLGKAGNELQELAACGEGAIALGEALLTLVEVRAPEEEIAALRTRLEDLLKDLQALAADDHKGPGVRRYRLMLCYYPLVKPPSTA